MAKFIDYRKLGPYRPLVEGDLVYSVEPSGERSHQYPHEYVVGDEYPYTGGEKAFYVYLPGDTSKTKYSLYNWALRLVEPPPPPGPEQMELF